MFKDRFFFEFSEKCFQLQIVDWISNTIFQILKGKIAFEFINIIEDNLFKFNGAKLHIVRFETTDKNGLYNKYKKFLE